MLSERMITVTFALHILLLTLPDILSRMFMATRDGRTDDIYVNRRRHLEKRSLLRISPSANAVFITGVVAVASVLDSALVLALCRNIAELDLQLQHVLAAPSGRQHIRTWHRAWREIVVGPTLIAGYVV